jgi:hypothetical protein
VLLLASMSAGAIFLVLVLFSTLGQAPLDGQQRRISLTCRTKAKAIPCKDANTGIPLWTTGVQADTGPHSLTSRTSSYNHVAFTFLDPVSVTSTTVYGLCLLFLLGATAWTIIIVVWIVCTAVVLRIRPLTRRRTIIIKYYIISGKQLKMCT